MSELHSHVRYCSDVVSIADVRCRPSTNRLSGEGSRRPHMKWYSRGRACSFGTSVTSNTSPIPTTCCSSTKRGLSCYHPVSGGDDCTSFVFSTDIPPRGARCLRAANLRPAGKTISFQVHAVLGLKTIIRQQQLRQRLKDGLTSDCVRPTWR